MARRVLIIEPVHAEALAVLDELGAEPEMHRRHAAFYAYEFFVARR